MRKSTIALVFGMVGLFAGMLLSNVSAAPGTSYGEDRAQIEDLQARYLLALDFDDPQLYASTFTPDASSGVNPAWSLRVQSHDDLLRPELGTLPKFALDVLLRPVVAQDVVDVARAAGVRLALQHRKIRATDRLDRLRPQLVPVLGAVPQRFPHLRLGPAIVDDPAAVLAQAVLIGIPAQHVLIRATDNPLGILSPVAAIIGSPVVRSSIIRASIVLPAVRIIRPVAETAVAVARFILDAQ